MAESKRRAESEQQKLEENRKTGGATKKKTPRKKDAENIGERLGKVAKIVRGSSSY